MYTGGLLSTERPPSFDTFLSPHAAWDDPLARTPIEALREEEEDECRSPLTAPSSSSSSSSASSLDVAPRAIPTRMATPSRSLSASPAASFLSSFFSPAQEAPKPDDEGQVVAGYTLGGIIGYGSTSIIRRAASSSGATAAVKIVRRADLVRAGNAPLARRKLQHEASIWTTLSHEHILPLFSAVHTTYADYFFTLYCPAGSLFDILKRDGNPALPQDDAGMMFRQIVRGMRYLHEVANYVHRDLKLENVLVDEMGVCKICDFGMSRKIGSVEEEDEDADTELAFNANANGSSVHRAQTLNVASANRRHAHAQLNHVLNRHAGTRHHRNSTSTNEPAPVFQPGSLPYAAPELLLPQTSEVLQPHPSQDIWALGVILYALLTGKLPFQDSFEPRLQMKILNGTYELPQGIGRGAERILQGCLDRNVPTRWTIAMVDEVAWGVGWGAEGDDATPSELQAEHLEYEYECEVPSRSRSHSRPGRIHTPDWLPDQQEEHHTNANTNTRSRPSIEAASRRSTSRAKRSLSRAPVLTDKSTSSRSVSRSMSRHPRGASPSSASASYSASASASASTPTEPYTPSSAGASAGASGVSSASGGPYSAFFNESALDTSAPAHAAVQRERGRRERKYTRDVDHSLSLSHSHSHSHSRSPSPSIVPSTPLDALLVASSSDLDMLELEHPDELHLDHHDPESSSRGRRAVRSLDFDDERPGVHSADYGVGVGGPKRGAGLDFDAWHDSHSREYEHEREAGRGFANGSTRRAGGISSSAFVGQADDFDVDDSHSHFTSNSTSRTTTTATGSGTGFTWRQRHGSSPPTSARVQQKLGLGLELMGVQKTALEPFLNSSASSSSSSLALRSRSAEC